MNKRISIVILAAIAAACNNAAPSSPQTASSNSTNRPMRSEQMQQQNSIAHTTEARPGSTPPPNPNAPGKFAQGGDPIDTAKFDGVIAEAEKNLKAKPDDAAAKTALADALFDRGFALTEARQYAAALGDYRKALKYVPDHAESKKWIDQIVGIYQMLNKSAPKEGEEPPPLPFKKEA